MRKAQVAIALALGASFYTICAGADGAPPKGSVTSVELARSAGATCELRADERFLYWTTVDYNFKRPSQNRTDRGAGGQVIDWRYERATIQRLPKAGGSAEVVARIEGDRLSNFNLDENYFYWNGQRRDDLWRVPKVGGTPVRIDDGKYALFGTVRDSTYFYARDQSRRPVGLLRIPRDGGGATVAVRSQALLVALGVDQDSIFWSERVGGTASVKWAFKTAKKVGGPARTIEGIDELPNELVFADEIYLVTNHAAYSVNRATLKARRLAAATDYGDRGSVAVDDNFLYWAEGKTGEVRRVPKRGGTATVVATGGEPCAVVVDKRKIFWIDRVGNRIVQTPVADE
jgi:hypothetical protein